jgi:hypothetical protein
MGFLDGIAIFGKIRMDITIVFSVIVAIISLILLIWLITSFEENYVTKKAVILDDPVCTTDKNITTGTTTVKFRYNNKDYSLKVNTGDGCYNYTQNSSINIKFDPSSIESTIIIASNDPKGIFILITLIFLIVSILSFVYNYVLRNNKVAETISGAQGVTQGIKSLL